METYPVPRKLTPALITALSTAIANGNYPYTAASLCGICWETLARWLRLGAEQEVAGVEGIYLELYTAIKKAEAEAENKMIEVVRAAAVESKNWLPAITYLERRYPERWGRRERRSIDINETKSIRITHVEVVLDRDGQVVEGVSYELKKGGTDGQNSSGEDEAIP